jgi:hypothetical protein
MQVAVERFDQESFWIAAEICQYFKPKYQASMISKFIHTAMRCHTLGNYFSLFTILGALNFPEVSQPILYFPLPSSILQNYACVVDHAYVCFLSFLPRYHG